ncbi:MAG: nickel pincer cofactor biosynthesis protein LarB [Thaumarchaeota archaeon]|nr:nickel pincer cofactor biosynthesis protein LarB [Nitrososphaerota archaeon]
MRKHLERLARGEISVEEAEKFLRLSAIDEVEQYAKLDVNREMRKGVPEIIFAEGKNERTLLEIVVRALKSQSRVIVSRANQDHLKTLRRKLPKGVKLEVKSSGRIILVKSSGYQTEFHGGVVGILTAGTSDIPIAEEAEVVANEMGCKVVSAYDVGVAGVHRVFKALKTMLEKNVDVIIVVAGMEGALPSVVAGLVDLPVIGVPTSFGYGLGEKGLAALMTMLQSCSLGIGVVNIDGGVAAGTVAALIARRAARRSS